MWKFKSVFFIFTAFWLLIGYQSSQVHSETYTMTYNPNMFDDQYIGCSEKLEKIMPKVLLKEKANKQFKDAWINAAEQWYEIADYGQLPEGFQDEYGIALLTFTNNYPKGTPIYQQLNGNLSIAGTSQKDYMEKFHFKALHFYLTRALQMLKPNCKESFKTYRGSPHSFLIRPLFKFGRFTSSSLKVEVAQVFGTKSLFQITTCFGARIDWLSFFPSEAEVLIPPTEKFLYVTKENSLYILKSTGEMCSYFNCAFLGAEKRDVAACRSDTYGPTEETQVTMSLIEMEERINVLEDQISQNHLYRDDRRAKVNDVLIYLDKTDTASLMYMLGLEDRLEDLTTLVLHLLLRELNNSILLSDHQKLLTSLQDVLVKQKEAKASPPNDRNGKICLPRNDYLTFGEPAMQRSSSLERGEGDPKQKIELQESENLDSGGLQVTDVLMTEKPDDQ